MKEFTTPIGDVIVGEDGIIRISHNEHKATLEGAKEHIRLMNENLSQNTKRLLLVDGSNLRKTSGKEVRDFLRSEEATKMTTALAIVSTSSLVRIGANLIMSFSKPPYPFKMFATEDKAIAWLKGQDEALSLET